MTPQCQRSDGLTRPTTPDSPMRLASLATLAILPLLAACDSSSPPAQSGGAATTPAKPAAVKPAAPVGFPFNARPMLGTWASDGAQCASNPTVITATTYTVGGKSAPLALTDNKDGTFTTTVNGQRLTLTPIFGPPGEGIRIAQGDARSTNVFRCSAG
jgi:hypothetical protein